MLNNDNILPREASAHASSTTPPFLTQLLERPTTPIPPNGSPADSMPSVQYPLTAREIEDDLLTTTAELQQEVLPEEELLKALEIDNPQAKAVAEYDPGVDLDEVEDEENLCGLEEVEDEEENERQLGDSEFASLVKETRVEAAKRTEANRREGGRRTQSAMVKAWNVSISDSIAVCLTTNLICDDRNLLRLLRRRGRSRTTSLMNIPCFSTSSTVERGVRRLLVGLTFLGPLSVQYVISSFLL